MKNPDSGYTGITEQKRQMADNFISKSDSLTLTYQVCLIRYGAKNLPIALCTYNAYKYELFFKIGDQDYRGKSHVFAQHEGVLK